MNAQNFIFYVGVLAGTLESNIDDPKFIKYFEDMGYKRGNFENLKTELQRVARCLYGDQETGEVRNASGAI